MEWIDTWKIKSAFQEKRYSDFHIHDRAEMLYVIDGTLNVRTNSGLYTVKSGQMVIFAPFEPHSVNPSGYPYERIGMSVNCEALHSIGAGPLLVSVLKHRPEGWVNVFDVDTNPVLRHIIEEIRGEYIDDLPRKDEMLEVSFHHFLLELYRMYPDRFSSSMADEIIDSAKHYIENHIDNLPPISEIAARYYLTPSHFIVRFKNQIGYTPKKYHNLCRVARARCLLRETELPLWEIAERCGFSDSNNFIRCFRETTGITPGKFRTLKDERQ